MSEIHVFLRALRSWGIWVLVITVVAGAAGFGATQWFRKPVHRASVTLSAGDPSQITTDLDSERLGEELAPTYRELADSDLVLAPVIEKLSLDTTTHKLSKRVNASVVDKTPLIKITASARTKSEAISIANAVADQLVTVAGGLQSQDIGTSDLTADLATLQAKIADGEASLESMVKSYLVEPVDIEKPEEARHIDALQGQIRVWRDSYQATLQQLQAAPQAHPLVVVNQASAAGTSGGLKTSLLNGVLAAVAGLLLGIGILLVFSQSIESTAFEPELRRRGERRAA